MNLLISQAWAQGAGATGASDGSGGGLAAQAVQFAPLILIFIVFYFLLFRPQQQKQKETKTMLAALRRGDRVVTAGGILAVVQKVREGTNEVEVEIAPNVRVTVLRDTIGSVIGAKTNEPAATKTV